MREFLPFIDPRLKMGWDENIGHGVFCSAPIKKGEFVEIAPVVIIDKMPEDFTMAKYVIAWGGKIGLPLGWTMLYNHSDDNCCEYCVNIYEGLLAIVAMKDIGEGRQLTVNYGPDWFSSRGMEKVSL